MDLVHQIDFKDPMDHFLLFIFYPMDHLIKKITN